MSHIIKRSAHTRAQTHTRAHPTPNAALVGNLGGLTSGLLSLDAESACAKRLDRLFPVSGFRRCVDAQNGYGASFVIYCAALHGPCCMTRGMQSVLWARWPSHGGDEHMPACPNGPGRAVCACADGGCMMATRNNQSEHAGRQGHA